MGSDGMAISAQEFHLVFIIDLKLSAVLIPILN
jgi:hypothetical protein